jgi:ATP-dependent helicase/nuclease subunit B
MSERGLELVSPRGAELLVDEIMQVLRKPGAGYLWQLPPTEGLARAVHAAIETMRWADLQPSQLQPAQFEVGTKGNELAQVFEHYVAALHDRNLVDRADILHMAISRLEQGLAAVPDDLLVLVPEDINATGLEGSLLNALPASRRQSLPVDQPIKNGETGAAVSDLALLRWLGVPAAAPPPTGDGAATIFRAIGEVNEVREVLRRCLAAGYPLDQVELLHTDSDTYVPLVYETLAQLQPDLTNLDDLPVTFLEGVPARKFRPGRALIAWLEWIRNDFPQTTLHQMIREGILIVPSQEDSGISFSSLAQVFCGIGIGFGRNRYQPMLNEQIDSLELRIEAAAKQVDEDGEADQNLLSSLQRRMRATRLLHALIEKLFEVAPQCGADSRLILAGARRFLDEQVRHGSDVRARRR